MVVPDLSGSLPAEPPWSSGVCCTASPLSWAVWKVIGLAKAPPSFQAFLSCLLLEKSLGSLRRADWQIIFIGWVFVHPGLRRRGSF